MKLYLKFSEFGPPVAQALDVSDAMCKMFIQSDDIATIDIEGFHFSLRLKYEFADILDDVLDILADISNDNEGCDVYGFSQSDSFDSDWMLEWSKDGVLIVNFEWRKLPHDASIVQAPRSTVIKTYDFLKNWNSELQKLLKSLEGVDFELNDQKERIFELNSRVSDLG